MSDAEDTPENTNVREGFEGADDETEAPNPNPEKKFEGYGNVSYQETTLKPPPAVVKPSGEEPKQEFSSAATLSEQQCRDALMEEVNKHCCWGKGPVENMQFTSIQSSYALHLTLESFCESRGTSYAFVPYGGGPVDGPENGVPPGPWDIQCSPDVLHQTHQKFFSVPHTEYTAMCHRCHGAGQVRCSRCRGWGRVRCGRCRGTGRRRVYRGQDRGWQSVNCSSCVGGRRRCFRCGGDGRVRCPTCQGLRWLKHYIKLTINFVNHLSDFILENTDLMDDLIRNASGTPIYEQQVLNVWPITSYPVPEVNANSAKLIAEHNQAFQNERRLMQRQKLRSVPVTECHYSYKEENRRYWVYGHECRIQCPDYPAQCCWGCNLL